MSTPPREAGTTSLSGPTPPGRPGARAESRSPGPRWKPRAPCAAEADPAHLEGWPAWECAPWWRSPRQEGRGRFGDPAPREAARASTRPPVSCTFWAGLGPWTKPLLPLRVGIRAWEPQEHQLGLPRVGPGAPSPRRGAGRRWRGASSVCVPSCSGAGVGGRAAPKDPQRSGLAAAWRTQHSEPLWAGAQDSAEGTCWPCGTAVPGPGREDELPRSLVEFVGCGFPGCPLAFCRYALGPGRLAV